MLLLNIIILILFLGTKKENMYGLQFHPEKSGNEGLKILKNLSKSNYEKQKI